MSGRIGDDKVEEIRDRTDIVELVSSYLPLKRSGVNHFGLCPFHSEKSPSFSVNAARQRFHCFGCGEGGDVFGFLMQMEGLSFPEAIRRLGELAGVEVEEERIDPEEEARRKVREELGRVNEAVAQFYQHQLLRSPEGEPGRRYLKQRGYDADIARKFMLGYAPDRWENLAGFLAEKEIEPRLARELGLTRAGKEGRVDYDLFRGRLIFPICGLSGSVVAFGGRLLGDGQPKYLNSPESPVYHKGRVLYGLGQGRDAIRRAGEVIVVEGYFDLLALSRAGIDNVVATCGTALTEDHARLLKRYADRVRLLFDQDRAGRAATFRAMELLLPSGVATSVIELEAGDDPDTFLPREGKEAFDQRLQQARPALEVFIDAAFAGQEPSIEGKARAAEEVLGKLALLKSDFERDLYLKALADRSGIGADLLQERMKRQPDRPPRRAEPQGQAPSRQAPSRQEPPPPSAPYRSNERPAPPRPADPARVTAGAKDQQWLFNLMLGDAAARQKVAKEGLESFFLDTSLLELAARILALFDERDQWGPEELKERLTDEQKTIFSGILVADPGALAEETEEIFEGCRKAVEKGRLKKRSRELLTLIQNAERSGDAEGLSTLHREYTDINRKLRR